MPGSGRIILNENINPGSDYRVEGRPFDELLAWKPRHGSAVTVGDPSGRICRARVAELHEAHAVIAAYEEIGVAGKPLDIILLQALPEKERMELIIQKTTELGVTSIVPFKSRRSTSLEERESRQKKAHRWQDIALRAAKQSRRPSIPIVRPYSTFKEALDFSLDCDLKLAFFEMPGLKSLKEALLETDASLIGGIAVLTGPEGGFEKAEIDEAAAGGFIPVSLGKRIVRTETASILAVALVQYELGE